MSHLSHQKPETAAWQMTANGRYAITVGNITWEECRPELRINGRACPFGPWHQVESAGPDIACWRAGNEFGDWTLTFQTAVNRRGLPELSIRLAGELITPQADLSLTVLRTAGAAAEHVLTQGASMGGCHSLRVAAAADEEVTGHHVLVLAAADTALRLAFPLRQDHPAQFTVQLRQGRLQELRAGGELRHFGGRTVSLAPLMLCAAPDGFQLLTDYAEAQPDAPPAATLTPPPAGWNSWDYYRWTVTEEEVLENAAFIANDPVLSKHVRRIIVDDGWQYCYGEWEPNHHFPGGMQALATRLAGLGFEPGLWFAPTIVEPQARIAQLDHGLLARGESGEPCLAFSCMARHGFVLDPTQERVQQLLYTLFDRYAAMGYRYFKLDFMAATLNARRFADPAVPRGHIQDLIVAPIHRAVAGRAAILGCNYLFMGGGRQVHEVRVGGDIHATWEGIRRNAVSVAARFWANRRRWMNDPDFALCRGLDTATDPDLNRLRPLLVFIDPATADASPWNIPQVDIRRPQAEILLSIVLAAGGAVNLSDKLTRLNADGLDLARRTVSAETGDTAIPLDLFATELPARWLQRTRRGHRILLINWQDTPAEAVFDLAAHGITAGRLRNFWTDAGVPLRQGRIETILPPRSCLFATTGEAR